MDIMIKSVPPTIEWSINKFFQSSDGLKTSGCVTSLEGDSIRLSTLYMIEKKLTEGRYYITLKSEKDEDMKIHEVLLTMESETIELMKFSQNPVVLPKNTSLSLSGSYVEYNYGNLTIRTGKKNIEKKVFLNPGSLSDKLTIEDNDTVIEVENVPSSFLTNIRTIEDSENDEVTLYQCDEEVARSPCRKIQIKRSCISVCGRIKNRIPLCICSKLSKGPFPGTFLLEGRADPLKDCMSSKINFTIELEKCLTYPKKMRYRIISSKEEILASGEFSIQCKHIICFTHKNLIDEATIFLEWDNETIDWKTNQVVCITKNKGMYSHTIKASFPKTNLNVALETYPKGENAYWLDPEEYQAGIPYTLWNNYPNRDMIHKLFNEGLLVLKEAEFKYLITWGRSNAKKVIHRLISDTVSYKNTSEQDRKVPYA